LRFIGYRGVKSFSMGRGLLIEGRDFQGETMTQPEVPKTNCFRS
jgi:hypothetical protein